MLTLVRKAQSNKYVQTACLRKRGLMIDNELSAMGVDASDPRSVISDSQSSISLVNVKLEGYDKRQCKHVFTEISFNNLDNLYCASSKSIFDYCAFFYKLLYIDIDL